MKNICYWCQQPQQYSKILPLLSVHDSICLINDGTYALLLENFSPITNLYAITDDLLERNLVDIANAFAIQQISPQQWIELIDDHAQIINWSKHDFFR